MGLFAFCTDLGNALPQYTVCDKCLPWWTQQHMKGAHKDLQSCNKYIPGSAVACKCVYQISADTMAFFKKYILLPFKYYHVYHEYMHLPLKYCGIHCGNRTFVMSYDQWKIKLLEPITFVTGQVELKKRKEEHGPILKGKQPFLTCSQSPIHSFGD